jgi:hypothetical protein
VKRGNHKGCPYEKTKATHGSAPTNSWILRVSLLLAPIAAGKEGRRVHFAGSPVAPCRLSVMFHLPCDPKVSGQGRGNLRSRPSGPPSGCFSRCQGRGRPFFAPLSWASKKVESGSLKDVRRMARRWAMGTRETDGAPAFVILSVTESRKINLDPGSKTARVTRGAPAGTAMG